MYKGQKCNLGAPFRLSQRKDGCINRAFNLNISLGLALFIIIIKEGFL